MKKKLGSLVLLFVATLIFFTNYYFEIEYNLTLVEIFKNSTSLTLVEKEYLKERGKLVYAADNNSPPLRFVDPSTAQYRGIVLDYIRALSIELETEIEIKPMIWKDALESLKTGKSDLCDMFPSEARSVDFIFSDPIYTQRSIILKNQGDLSINNVKDLNHKKIAVQRGDFVIEFLSSKLNSVYYVYTNDYEDSLELLEAGEVDAIVGDEPVISYFIEQKGLQEKYISIDPPLYEKNVVLSLPKEDIALQAIVNKGIYSLNKKNTMSKIQQKWFGISASITNNNNQQKIDLLASFFLANSIIIISVFYIFNSSLKDEVNARTNELTISKNDLQTTFDGIIDFMIVVDKKGYISNCNASFANYFKKDRDKIISTQLTPYTKKLGGYQLLKIIKKTLDTLESQNLEYSFYNISYEVDVYPLKGISGEVDRTLVMIKDITESILVRENLLQANKMSAVGQLAAGVAHEIRNPLGLIRNYSYILKRKIDTDDEIQVKAIKVIESSVERSNKIIDNLLNFSRISDLIVKEVNLKSFLESIINLNSKLMEESRVEVKLLCDSNLKLILFTDSLRHIIINILNNSIDAIKDRGIITIWANISENELHLRIIDNGFGIKEYDLEKVFNPFHTTKAPGMGTGLGLFISYNEISRMNGHILVKSKENIGTTVHLILPINQTNSENL